MEVMAIKSITTADVMLKTGRDLLPIHRCRMAGLPQRKSSFGIMPSVYFGKDRY